MLRLVNIKKSYKTAGGQVDALKGIRIAFRRNEFVSILGPSGCGKTTTLNIIGGLDKYTSGDLIILGKSTKQFTSRDWDFYRNQRIGFIFQSYNLIPHQTVLENVELALTISGISREERIKKAKAALDKVGLTDQYNKKPNQLSGGQCQRVAIARALVNEPEILLADEPTGALDTKTSVQIMELIREIAKDKLVIMVTHNPDLAEQYSSRIIRLLDGEITEDTNPFTEEEEIKEVEGISEEEKNKKTKAKMSLGQAIRLSWRNLWSKRKRTILTSVAGSIGIIGISAVLAVSAGVKNYIASMEDDMLSGNPVTISESTYDLTSIMNSMSTQEKAETVIKNGYVNVSSMIKYIIDRYGSMESSLITNDITREYVDYVLSMPEDYVSAITLDYGIDVTNNLYTDFTKDGTEEHTENISLSSIKSIYTSLLGRTDFADYASLVGQMSSIMAEAPDAPDYIEGQYDIKAGKIATEPDEIMIVVDSKSELTDIVLAELGYYTQDEFLNCAYRYTESDGYTSALDKDNFSYDELLNKTFTYYPNDEVYTKVTDEIMSKYYPFNYNYQSSSLSNGYQLKVVGILQPKETISYGCLSSGFYYTEGLTKKILADNLTSELCAYLNENGGSVASTVSTQNGTKMVTGITYTYSYLYNGETYSDTACIGSQSSSSQMMSLISSMMGGGSGSASSTQVYTLSAREAGGNDLPQSISIYPVDFDQKDLALNYLDAWNDDGDITVDGKVLTKDDRSEIKYTDTLSLIISMINMMINVVTIALVAFTALSLVVSCVMIAIITYVSVVERVKEIGVIRALGGRKKDVSHLFNAETIIIGSISGLFGIGVTYLIQVIVNIAVHKTIPVGIVLFKPTTALIMLALSILLTMISGLAPASNAANQDPVNALRSE